MRPCPVIQCWWPYYRMTSVTRYTKSQCCKSNGGNCSYATQSKLTKYLRIFRVTSINPFLPSDIHRKDEVTKTYEGSLRCPSITTTTTTTVTVTTLLIILLTTAALAEGLDAREAQVVWHEFRELGGRTGSIRIRFGFDPQRTAVTTLAEIISANEWSECIARLP